MECCGVDHISCGPLYLASTSGSSSVVECFLAKEDVAGSTPVSRSNHSPPAIHSFNNIWVCVIVQAHRGAVPKW